MEQPPDTILRQPVAVSVEFKVDVIDTLFIVDEPVNNELACISFVYIFFNMDNPPEMITEPVVADDELVVLTYLTGT